MTSARTLLNLTQGHSGADAYRQCAEEEPRLMRKRPGCAECPLRRGGEWEGGALQALQGEPEIAKLFANSFGCHVHGGPCSGARRIATAFAKQRSKS